MDIHELTKKIEEASRGYSEEYGLKRDNDWFVFKIQEELGEVIKEYLMLTKRGRQKGLSEKEIKKQFETEVADLLCQVLLFANHNKIDIIKIIDEKWFSKQRERENKKQLNPKH